MEDLVNEALDAMDTVRAKLQKILELAESYKDFEDIVSIIKGNASVFANANSILEDILSNIEDL